MQASWAMTMPALLGPLARHVTNADPERFRSSVTGQANALLVNPHFETGATAGSSSTRSSRAVTVCWARTPASATRSSWRAAAGACSSANLHASNDPDPLLVGAEIDRAASFLAGDEPCVLCGLNVRRHAVPGFSEPIDGVDQVLVRGFELERGPDTWPEERHRTNGLVLPDHAPVEAVIASTS